MGLFGNGKKKKKQFDEVMAGIRAPKIPENAPSWFVAGAVDMPSQSIFTDSMVFANSWINVEVAAVFVGSRIPKPCDKCEEEVSCKSCGKRPDNYLKAMAANADGDYLVWNLTRDQLSHDMRLCNGIFTFFDTSIYATFDTEDGFKFSSQQMVPVRMGSIKVADSGDGSGKLFMADAFAAVDSEDFIASAEVQPGDYEVIVFLGYSNTGDLAPMAIGAFGSECEDQLDELLAKSPALNDEIRGIISGSPDGTVFARMGNNQEHYAEINSNFPGSEGDISWILQLKFESDPDAMIQMVRSDSILDDYLAVIYSLNLRGKHALALQMVDHLESDFALTMDKYLKDDIVAMRKLEPGFTLPAFHCSRTAIALYAEGDRFMAEGEFELALDCYLDSSLAGNPNALGSLTWHLLLKGECQEAIDGFEQAKSEAIDGYRSGKKRTSFFHRASIDYEIANAESNYALCKLGTGTELGEAIAIWGPNLPSGHTETRFFLAMAQHKVGDFQGRDTSLAGLSADQWGEMKDEMKEISRNAKGFFQSWCSEGADFIKQFRP
jgi:tetratricopeptide (TPR) repeat protein